MADHWGVRPPPDAAGPGVIQLEGDAIAASPPNPFIAKLMASPPLPPPDALESALGEWTPLEIQFVATLSVATFLALLVCSLRCWVRHVQARALAEHRRRRARSQSRTPGTARERRRREVPIAGVRTTRAHRRGVRPAPRSSAARLRRRGRRLLHRPPRRERRIGARTAFADVRAARSSASSRAETGTGLVAAKSGKARGKAAKAAAAAAAAAGEDDDISVISRA